MIKKTLIGIGLVCIGLTFIKVGGIGWWCFLVVVSLLVNYEIVTLIDSQSSKPKAPPLSRTSAQSVAQDTAHNSQHLPQKAIKSNPKANIWIVNGGALIWWGALYLHPGLLNTGIVKSVVTVAIGLLGVELALKKSFWTSNAILNSLKIIGLFTVLFSFLYGIRLGQIGLPKLILAVMTVWMTDSFAYFVGKSVGTHKLTDISPNKTVEGAVGGTVLAVIGAYGIALYTKMATPSLIPILAIASVLAHLGDLHESLVKRHFKVKDSSNLIPGHGGFYDRSDSYLMTVPFLFYMLGGF